MVDDTDNDEISSEFSPAENDGEVKTENKIGLDSEADQVVAKEDSKNTESSSSSNLDSLPNDTLNDIQNQSSDNTSVEISSLSNIEEDKEITAADKTTVLETDIDSLLFNNENKKATYNDPSILDSLLGDSIPGKLSSKLSSVTQSGMEAILKRTMIYYERLPMLEVVFDRLIRLLSTSLRNFTSDNVEIRTETSKAMRFGDYLNSIPLPAMLGVFKAEQWDNQGLIVVDSELTYSVVDVLLGGRHSNVSLGIDGRTYTTIECNLIEKLISVFLEDLSAAFEPVCPVDFTFERLELNPHFAMISRASNAGILIKLGIEVNHRYGKISLFLPYATIEPIRELLLQNFMGEKFGRDSIWEHHLVDQLKETEITFDVQLLTQTMPLASILSWRIGDTINFSLPPPTLVTAKSGDIDLFRGVVGHKNGKISVKIQDNLLNINQYKEGNIK